MKALSTCGKYHENYGAGGMIHPLQYSQAEARLLLLSEQSIIMMASFTTKFLKDPTTVRNFSHF